MRWSAWQGEQGDPEHHRRQRPRRSGPCSPGHGWPVAQGPRRMAARSPTACGVFRDLCSHGRAVALHVARIRAERVRRGWEPSPTDRPDASGGQLSRAPGRPFAPASERHGMHPTSTASQALVLNRLPSGELVWLRREPQPVAGVDDPHPRYVLTPRGPRLAGPRARRGSAVCVWLVLGQLTATVRHNPPVCTPQADPLVWKIAGEGRFIVQQAGSPEFGTVSTSREQLRCRCQKPHAVTPCAHERTVTDVVR